MAQSYVGCVIEITAGPFEGLRGEIIDYDHSDDTHLVLMDRSELVVGVRIGEFDILDDEIETPDFGMTSDQLAGYVQGFAELAAKRVTSSKYDHGSYQEFECADVEHVLAKTMQEIESWAAYAAMAHLRVARMLKALKETGVA
jgi:hypothetical protein